MTRNEHRKLTVMRTPLSMDEREYWELANKEMDLEEENRFHKLAEKLGYFDSNYSELDMLEIRSKLV